MRGYRVLQRNDNVIPVVTDNVTPVPGPFEVCIRVKAASLNYRDLIVLDGAANGGYEGRIPLSDAAGRISAVGDHVTRWKIGDRVAASFFRDWLDGPFKVEYLKSALGGSVTDGVLVENVVLPEASLVAIPEHLSMEHGCNVAVRRRYRLAGVNGAGAGRRQ
jgi:NADPH:quinone reductase-like Zn-dependent oxidoreductase